MRAPRLGRCHENSHLDSSEDTGSSLSLVSIRPWLSSDWRGLSWMPSTRLSPTALTVHSEGGVNINGQPGIHSNVPTRNGDKNIHRYKY